MRPLRNRKICRALCVFAALCTLSSVWADDLLRSSPEAEGVSSAKLQAFVDGLGKIDGMHSVMVVRHGKVIMEGWWAPYTAADNHVLYSLSKSFTSTAVGFAVAEGKLKVTDPVLKFFPDEAPADPTENLKAMRVQDLLTMTTGHEKEPPTAPDAMSAASFLSHPVPRKPGTHFKYNTAATFMQSAIVQKVTGKTVLDYLKPRLFEPLGIENPKWDRNYQGISLGGYGLRVRTEDIAKLGQLYLQKGIWKGVQLLPREWVAAATSKQVTNGNGGQSDWAQGYGYQFWRCRHNAYRGDGAFGQYCVVMPDQEIVVAVTSGVKNMQAVLNVIWRHVLPAAGNEALPADGGSLGALEKTLAGLALEPVVGRVSSLLAKKMVDREFVFPKNEEGIESLSLVAVNRSKGLELVIRRNGEESRFPCSHGAWAKGRTAYSGGHLAQFPNEPVAGSFAWTKDGTCVIRVCAIETPFEKTLTLTFSGEEVTLEVEANVAFGPSKSKPLVGRVKK